VKRIRKKNGKGEKKRERATRKGSVVRIETQETEEGEQISLGPEQKGSVVSQAEVKINRFTSKQGTLTFVATGTPKNTLRKFWL